MSKIKSQILVKMVKKKVQTLSFFIGAAKVM